MLKKHADPIFLPYLDSYATLHNYFQNYHCPTPLQLCQLPYSYFSSTAMSRSISMEGQERTTFQVKIVAWKMN